MAWNPTEIIAVLREPLGTGAQPLVVATDEGTAFCKVLGNNQGPSALACDFLGLKLASWLGLPTPDVAILDFPQVWDGHPLGKGCAAVAGPALLTREVVDAQVWGGTGPELDQLANPEVMAGLVLLDTWLLNTDRFAKRDPPPYKRNERNVLFGPASAPGQLLLYTIDLDQCIRRGGSELTLRTLSMDARRSTDVYGLFPEFAERLRRTDVQSLVNRLGDLTLVDVQEVVRQIPNAWLPDRQLRQALAEFVVERARFVATWIESWLAQLCLWEPVLPFPMSSEP